MKIKKHVKEIVEASKKYVVQSIKAYFMRVCVIVLKTFHPYSTQDMFNINKLETIYSNIK